MITRQPKDWDSLKPKKKIMGLEIIQGNCIPLQKVVVSAIYDIITQVGDTATTATLRREVLAMWVEVLAQTLHASTLPPVGFRADLEATLPPADEEADSRYRDFAWLSTRAKVKLTDSSQLLQAKLPQLTLERLNQPLTLTTFSGEKKPMSQAPQIAMAKEQVAFGSNMRADVCVVHLLNLRLPTVNGTKAFYLSCPKLESEIMPEKNRLRFKVGRKHKACESAWSVVCAQRALTSSEKLEDIPRICYSSVMAPLLTAAIGPSECVVDRRVLLDLASTFSQQMYAASKRRGVVIPLADARRIFSQRAKKLILWEQRSLVGFCEQRACAPRPEVS